MFVNQAFAQKHKLETPPLPNPVPVHNVDGTPNKNGSIMEGVEVMLQYGQHTEKVHLAVTNLRWQTIIIGHSWLTHHNPEVDWACQSVTMSQCPPECQGQSNRGMAEDDGPEPGVGWIMFLCMTCLYRPVLTLRTYHCHYESGIPPLTCFFDQNPGNSFSTCPPNYGVIIS